MRAVQALRTARRGRLFLLALLAAAALALALVLAADESSSPTKRASGASTHEPHQKVLSGTWAFRPQTLAELVSKTPTVVVATVQAVNSGPPLVDGAEDGGLPTQRIQFKVDDRVYGKAPDVFDLFKTGSGEEWIEGDPPYAAGEQYLLFLEPRINGDGSVEPDTYVPVAPDGRLKIDGDSVRREIAGFLAGKLDGDSVGSVKRAAEAAKKGG